MADHLRSPGPSHVSLRDAILAASLNGDLSTRWVLDLAARSGHVDLVYGHRVADPYRWLEDDASEQTIAWLRAQDLLFAQHAWGWAGRDRLRGRLAQLLDHETVSTPVWRRDRCFFTRHRPGHEHPLLVVRQGGEERVLMDPMVLDPGGLITLDAWQPSWEGELVAIQMSKAGTEQGALVVLDVATGDRVGGPITGVRYSPVAWLPGGEAFYYVRSLPDSNPASSQLHQDGRLHRCVWFHRIGTDAAEDPLVFGVDEDEPTRPGVSITPDGRGWWSRNYGTGTRNDLWVAELSSSDPNAPQFTAVQRGVDAVTTLHIHHDGYAYLRSNLGASRYRLCVARPHSLSPEAWREVVPESPEANLEEFAVVDDPSTGRTQLLVAWTRHALSELTVHDGLSGRRLATIPLSCPGTAGHLLAPPEGGGRAWFEYTDPTTPRLSGGTRPSPRPLSERRPPPDRVRSR